MTERSHRIRETVLTIGAIAGAACFAVGIATYAFGVTPLVVESGSMSPTIETGALAIARDHPAKDLRVGDIVRVKTGPNVSVTHRIVKITHRPTSATIRLKGDANKVPDAQIYTVEHAGLILFSIPFAGRVVAAGSGPIGLFLLGGYVAFVAMIVIDERRTKRPTGTRGSRKAAGKRRVRRPGRRSRHDSEEPAVEDPDVGESPHRAIGGIRALTVLAVLLGGVMTWESAPEPTFAAWTDGVDVGTSTLSTYTVPAPTLGCGALGVLSVTFTWAAVSGATNYTLFYNAGASSTTVAGTSTTITGALNLSSSAWLVANRNFGSTTWTSAKSNTRNYTFLVVSLCG